MKFDWLRVCATGQTEDCIAPIGLAYLAILVIGAVILAVAARRSREFSTATLALMTVAIALNIAVGAIVYALRLPIYLDSIGTVLVGVLAGPFAGALTGMLATFIWSILPVAGGAGPTAAFFAPVAGVIGLMAGFWAGRGVFRLRAEDPTVGRFLAMAFGLAAAGVAFFAIGQTVGIPALDAQDPQALLDNQTRFVLIGLFIVAVGLAAAWLSNRTVFALKGDDPRARTYLAGASAIAAGLLVFAVIGLLFGPSGYFSSVDGSDPGVLGGTDLRGLALTYETSLIVSLLGGLIVGVLVGAWARRGENARLFPVWVGGLTTGLVAATISAPIAAVVFGGVTGGGTDAVVAFFRSLGLNVFQSAFAQGLTSDPLDKTMSYTIVYAILLALPMTVRTMFSRGETTVPD